MRLALNNTKIFSIINSGIISLLQDVYFRIAVNLAKHEYIASRFRAIFLIICALVRRLTYAQLD